MKTFHETVSRHPQARALYATALRMAGVKKMLAAGTPHILDLAGGGGIVERVLREKFPSKNFHYANLDLSRRALAESGGSRVQAQRSAPPFASGKFDLVIYAFPETALHGSFWDDMIREERSQLPILEALRMLKKGGKLVYAPVCIGEEDALKLASSKPSPEWGYKHVDGKIAPISSELRKNFRRYEQTNFPGKQPGEYTHAAIAVYEKTGEPPEGKTREMRRKVSAFLKEARQAE
ncbi:MAG: class I SAM-dependent methyltransferase [Candidatus Micrarchaeota archaeon]